MTDKLQNRYFCWAHEKDEVVRQASNLIQKRDKPLRGEMGFTAVSILAEHGEERHSHCPRGEKKSAKL